MGHISTTVDARDLDYLNAGFTAKQWDSFLQHHERLSWAKMKQRRSPIPQKPFNPTFLKLPQLDNYEGIFNDEYWAHWEKKTYNDLEPFNSWVCPEKLERIANELGYTGGEDRLKRVLNCLRKGADIGCRGSGRLPTRHPNSKSTAEYGNRVADALQGWIVDGLCYGPLDEDELPWGDYSVNPITVKLKPNGKARICIDMSAPHLTGANHGQSATSVNSGIEADDFPTHMSSTKTFCESLMRSGCPSEVCKLDYNQAYKHIAVRKEDHHLQVFTFGGKFFGEVRLTFGCTSSAGLFDDLAKLVKEMAQRVSGTKKELVNQVLDDVVAVGSQGDGTVTRFYKAYRKICTDIGISLADESDVDKAFPA